MANNTVTLYLGTASLSVASASYAVTASFALNGGGGTSLGTGSTYPITSSWALTSSYSEVLQNTSINKSAIIVGLDTAVNVATLFNEVVIGNSASVNTNAIANSVVIGGEACFNTLNVVDSVIIGSNSGLNSIEPTNCTFIGYGADSLSGSRPFQSMALGYGASVSGSFMCAIGGIQGNAVKVTIGNTSSINTLDVTGNISCSVITASLFYGTASWTNNALTASNLNFIPPTSSYSLTTQYFNNTNTNTLLGTGVQSNTTFGANTAVGYQALANNNTYDNTAVGYQSLTNNILGSANTALGVNALSSNTSGSFNTALGFQTLYNNISTSLNTAIGAFALTNNTSGSNNTAVGYNALYFNTSGSNNTAVGYNTALSITTGNNNTIIGANVSGLAAGINNNIIIADGSGNQRIKSDANGNIGIGLPNPLAKLSIINSQTFSASVMDLQFSFDTSNDFRNGISNLFNGTFTDENAMNFLVSNATTNSVEVMTLNGTGKAAIGNIIAVGAFSPVNTLDVLGNISCSVITASLFYGTSSYANTASILLGSIVSSSYSLTSSYALNGGSGGSSLGTGSTYPITASWSLNSLTASAVAQTILVNYIYDTASVNQVDVTDGALYANGLVSINWSNYQLLDLNQVKSVDYLGRNLIDLHDFVSVDYGNRRLEDNASLISVDWNNRLTYDTSSFKSIDWNNRELFGNWTISGSFNSTGSQYNYQPYVTDTTSSINQIICSFTNAEQYCNLTTGNVTYNFTHSNLPTSGFTSNITLFLNNTFTGVSASLSFPASWTWIGLQPSYMTASKSAVLNLKSYGGSGSVIASWNPQY